MVSGAAAAEADNWRLGRPEILRLLTDTGQLPDAADSMTTSELLKLAQKHRLASRLTLTHMPQQVLLLLNYAHCTELRVDEKTSTALACKIRHLACHCHDAAAV